MDYNPDDDTAPLDTPPPSKEDIESRINAANTMISRGFQSSHIRAFLMEKYGIGRKEARALLGAARSRLREEIDLPPNDHRARVLDVFMGVMRENFVEPRDRIRAAEAYAKLLGLNAAGGFEETPMEVRVTLGDWRRSIRDAREKGELLSAAEPGGTDGGDGGTATPSSDGA